MKKWSKLFSEFLQALPECVSSVLIIAVAVSLEIFVVIVIGNDTGHFNDESTARRQKREQETQGNDGGARKRGWVAESPGRGISDNKSGHSDAWKPSLSEGESRGGQS